jgi:hypothetical protein
MSDAWIGLIGVVLGVVLSQGATWLNRKWDLKQEREERWKAFQRETILEAHSLVTEQYAATIRLAKEHAKTGFDAATEADEEYFGPLLVKAESSAVRLAVVAAHVEDGELHKRIDRVNEGFSVLTKVNDDESLATANAAVQQLIRSMNERVRELLPHLH